MTRIGAAVTTKPGQTWVQAIQAFESLTGRPMSVRRCFDSTPPSSLASSAARHDYDFNVGTSIRKSVLSIKPTMTTPLDTLVDLAGSIVQTDHECDIIIYHEPVDNMSGQAFVDLYQRSAVPFLDVGIPVGVCYTNWSATQLPFSDSKSALAHYWPGDEYVDFIAIDEYPANEITSTKDALPMSERTRRVCHFADIRAKPLSLTEFGVQATWDTIKSERWLRSVTDWAERLAVRGMPLRDICYFHSDVGGSFWLDNKPEYVLAYRDMATILQGA